MITDRIHRMRLWGEKMVGSRTTAPAGLNALALVHEMELYRLELEMQYEELRDARTEAVDLQKKYRDLFDFAPFAYFRLDRDGTILEANRAAADLTLTDLHTLIRNTSFSRLLAPGCRVSFQEMLQDVVDGGNRREGVVRLMQGRKLAHVQVVLETAGLSESEPEVKLAVLDVTERWQAMEDLRAAREHLEERVTERTRQLTETIVALQQEIAKREQVEQALRAEMEERLKAVAALDEQSRLLILQSRQAAMGEMIGSIAHQWRQPLNVIGLHFQRLQLLDGAGDLDRQMLETTVAEGMKLIQHMSKTIDDFRNYFRPDREKSSFSVADSITTALSLVRESFRHDTIELQADLDAGATLLGYPNEFSQALINILNNAKDVLNERHVAGGKVTVGSRMEQGCVLVTIADNAGGIDTVIIDKVFDPYFSTKGVQGTGIGLYMSKSIVENSMGGQLLVRNTGEGAEFSIRLPLAPQPLTAG